LSYFDIAIYLRPVMHGLGDSTIFYMAALGFGLSGGIKMDKMSYLEFVIPGIIAMTAMNSSFNGSGTRLVLDQIHRRSFDESLMAPISQPALLLGKALIGVLRGSVRSIAFLIRALIIRPQLHISASLFLSLALTFLIFSFLGVLSALLARSYDDMIMFTSINSKITHMRALLSAVALPRVLALPQANCI
jgi:hypothetical protein